MARQAAAKDPKAVMEQVKKAGMNLDVGVEVKRNTNILDVEVPPQMRLKIPSGIEFLDRLTGDGMGMNAGTGWLFTGGSGCGKTTLGLQLANALHGSKGIPGTPDQPGYPGCVVLYNTNEEAATQVKMTTERLNLKNGFIIGQDRLVPKCLAHMDYLMTLPAYKGKKPIIIGDSLQTLDDGFYANGGTNSNSAVRVTELFTNWVKKHFGVVILIGQVNKNGDFNGKNTIKHALDGHLHLYIDKGKKSDTYGERIFECQKNRYGSAGGQLVVGMGKHEGLYEKEGFEVG